MVEKIDFFTSFGHGEGGDHRQRLGIDTKGPTLLITDLAIWKPDPETKEFTVVSLHPGVTPRAGAGDLRLDGALRRQRWRKRRRRRELELDDVARPAGPHRARIRAGKEGQHDMAEAYICAYVRTPIGRYRRRRCLASAPTISAPSR